MGNTASTPNSSINETDNNINTLPYLIDEIALHYMLTQNAIDLHNITNKEYQDNLIVLTSNVIEKRLNNLELGYLNNRISGKDIEEIQDIMPANNKIKDKVITNISKFYIKIFTIYASIVSTFDPQYSYLDENGESKLFYLKDFDDYNNIPKHVKPSLVQLTNPMSLCRKRLNILKNRYDDTSEPGSVILNPGEKLCSVESTVKLTDEIGIKELDSLYYDIFDYNTKKWSKKSTKMKKKYNKDLVLFYRIFTGKKTKPSHIKSFHDIELLDFKKINSCSENNFLSDIVISNENKLIKDYKEKIDLIQNSTELNRIKLYDILKELFVVKMVDNEKSYTITPSLSLDKIIALEEQTRIILLDLYISCQKYFIQALIIFENIYESKDYTINEYRKENLMNIVPIPASINYKDSLTITPPFSPDLSGQIQPESVESLESNPESIENKSQTKDSDIINSNKSPGILQSITNFINPPKKDVESLNRDNSMNPVTNSIDNSMNPVTIDPMNRNPDSSQMLSSETQQSMESLTDKNSIPSKSNETKTNETTPDNFKSNETKSNETKSNETRPDNFKSNETKSNETKPDNFKSNETKSNETKPETANIAQNTSVPIKQNQSSNTNPSDISQNDTSSSSIMYNPIVEKSQSVIGSSAIPVQNKSISTSQPSSEPVKNSLNREIDAQLQRKF